jgi:translation initiation factor 2A
VLRFKIWHYSGTLLYERPWNKQEELWEVLWQLFPGGVFHEPMINYKPVEGIQPSQPQGESLKIMVLIFHYNE